MPRFTRLISRSQHVIAAAVLLIPIAGCQESSDPLEAAEAAVVQRVKYPASAQFARERIVGEAQTVCGLVNVRQATGTYTGWRRFYASGTPMYARVDASEEALRREPKISNVSGRVSYESLWSDAGCRDE